VAHKDSWSAEGLNVLARSRSAPWAEFEPATPGLGIVLCLRGPEGRTEAVTLSWTKASSWFSVQDHVPIWATPVRRIKSH
jgi:hypothetical protein